jgi:apolipoprotein N-acyltransferase
LRGHLLTGFSMGLLAHTQAEYPRLIQIADLAGGYTLSFLILLVSACLFQAVYPRVRRSAQDERRPWLPAVYHVLIAAAAIGGAVGYGQWRLGQAIPGQAGPVARVALVQGSLDTVFEFSPERLQETFDQYRGLTQRATREHANLDLVVWPESAFAVPETVVEEPLGPLPGSSLSVAALRTRLDAAQSDFQALLAGDAALANAHTDASRSAGTKLLIGTTSFVYGSGAPRTYNTALLVDRSGNVAGRYYKMHPVMFGEYIPFGSLLPWLYQITPLGGGLARGDGPKAFDVAGLRMAPSICFESTVPHLIRKQLNELARQGTPADVLVNVTNDGWFWGTGMLDLHFRCGVFRAVENRKPLVVAANTGISLWADGNGVVRSRGPRRQADVLFAEVQADGRRAPYASIGDWPACLLAAICVGLMFIALPISPRLYTIQRWRFPGVFRAVWSFSREA